jgi:hypothetical protein
MGGNWLLIPRFFDDPVYRSQYFCDLDMLQELVHAITGKRWCIDDATFQQENALARYELVVEE